MKAAEQRGGGGAGAASSSKVARPVCRSALREEGLPRARGRQISGLRPAGSRCPRRPTARVNAPKIPDRNDKLGQSARPVVTSPDLVLDGHIESAGWNQKKKMLMLLTVALLIGSRENKGPAGGGAAGRGRRERRDRGGSDKGENDESGTAARWHEGCNAARSGERLRKEIRRSRLPRVGDG